MPDRRENTSVSVSKHDLPVSQHRSSVHPEASQTIFLKFFTGGFPSGQSKLEQTISQHWDFLHRAFLHWTSEAFSSRRNPFLHLMESQYGFSEAVPNRQGQYGMVVMLVAATGSMSITWFIRVRQ